MMMQYDEKYANVKYPLSIVMIVIAFWHLVGLNWRISLWFIIVQAQLADVSEIWEALIEHWKDVEHDGQGNKGGWISKVLLSDRVSIVYFVMNFVKLREKERDKNSHQ